VLRDADRARCRAPEGRRAVSGPRGRDVHRAVLAPDRGVARGQSASAAGRAGSVRGPAVKTIGKWKSERLGREVTLVRWGTFGQPVLVFPTAGGDAEEIERMHLVGALGALIEAGKIKVYSCDSVAGRALLAREGTPQHQMWLQNQFHHYVRHEVAPAI